MPDQREQIGEVFGIDDVGYAPDAEQPKGVVVDGDATGALWEYHTLGTINDIPVQSVDQGLAISSTDDLSKVFRLVAVPKAEILRISAENTAGLDRYNELITARAAGILEIEDEQRNFDAATCSYIVWIRYSRLHYELNPRFYYMRKELDTK